MGFVEVHHRQKDAVQIEVNEHLVNDLQLALNKSGYEQCTTPCTQTFWKTTESIQPPQRRGPNRTPRIMSDEARQRIRLLTYLYRSGLSSAECAVALNLCKERVLQLLRRAGVERRQRLGGKWRGADGRYVRRT